ncbi:hypothetical protein [Pedobacter zeae]|uniref:Uncharacterized protein n=1 Tax=Pedobacter zeae TaxID=1737356 RepID=A0A7W6K8Q3_9SPHI|nr:hypothetical protein [Pedobacter zeae]MBB4107265.1 hypothetical protein [Pedobacter zeae]GGH06761.1 hypothetical protein GCM10007422_23620 [Pedobacter zeae]
MKSIHQITLVILTLLFAHTTSAQTKQDPRIAQFLSQKAALKTSAAHNLLQTLFPEYNLKQMQHICLIVGDWTAADQQDKRFKYLYQQRFYLAAKVDTLKDSPETIAEKISKMWNIYQQTGYTSCNASTFDVRDGNLLKYAVADKFEDFLQDAIKWKLDLNKIDSSDGMTLLDYIDDNLLRAKGSAFESTYKKYHDMFRKAGAKYKKEL